MLRTRPHLHVVAHRQREVAALIAEGLTDGEVDHRLSLAPGTTATYVEAARRRLEHRLREGRAAASG